MTIALPGLLAFNNAFARIEFPSIKVSLLNSRMIVLTLHIRGRLSCAVVLLLLLRLSRVARFLLRVLAVAERRRLLHVVQMING